MANDRQLLIRLVGDESDLLRSFRKGSQESSRFARTVERNLGTGAGGALTGFERLSAKFRANPLLGGLTGGAAAFGAVEVGQRLRESVGLASDLGEALSKNTQVFDASARSVDQWAQTMASSFGIARLEAVAAAGDFGGLLRTLDIGPSSAASMSKALVELGADLASFNNTSVADAIAALRSGLVGESEPLRRYQVLLSEARVTAEAYASGLANVGAKLTEEQKVLARYNLILKDSAQAQGDFARTSDGLANQSKILSAQLRDLETRLGAIATPILTDIAKNTNDVIAGFGGLGEELSGLGVDVPIVGDHLGGFANAAFEVFKRTNGVTGVLQQASDAMRLLGLRTDNTTSSLQDLSDKAGELLNSPLVQLGTFLDFLDQAPNMVDSIAKQQQARFDKAAPIRSGIQGMLDFVESAPKQITDTLAKAQALVDKANAAADKQRTGFENLMGKLSLKFDMASATGNLKAQLAALKDQERLLRDQIQVEGRTVELERQLWELGQQRAQVFDQRRQQRLDRLQGKQFQALGLTAEGDERVPTIANLRKQLAALTDRTAGTELATPKLKSQLAGIRKVLSGEFGKATRESRDRIKQLFQAIRQQFDTETGGGGPLTKTTSLNSKKILQGLGLDAGTAKELRARLSGFNTAGLALAGTPRVPGATPGPGGLFVVESYVTVNLDGEVVSRAVTKSQQKTARRNPKQKRGPAVSRNV